MVFECARETVKRRKMVKSTSCFKIITCGSDSTDKDDLEVPEVPV